MENLQGIKQLIVLFLRLNPEPIDAQVHALAQALGCDEQTLESIIYAMLGRKINDPDDTDIPVQADSLEVLEDAFSPDEIPLNDMVLNDGDPSNRDIGLQEETRDDGLDSLNRGIGSGQDLLVDDGVPDLRL